MYMVLTKTRHFRVYNICKVDVIFCFLHLKVVSHSFVNDRKIN